MFDSLWINIHAATMAGTDGYGIIENAAIGVKNGRIAWIGPEKDLPAAPQQCTDYVHDGEGRWLTPGLIDCHAHLAYAGNRAQEFEQRLQGASYAEIAKAGGGILSTVHATRSASEECLFEETLGRLRPLFREGVTSFEIKSGYGLDLSSERKLLRVATRIAEETGLRIQRTFLGAHACPPEYRDDHNAYVAHICAEMLPALHAEGLIDAVDVFCENIGFTPAETEKIFETARAMNLPVKLHAEQLSNQHGAALAADSNALSADHLEHLDEGGVIAMAESGTVAVLLPGAFYFLRETKLPPVEWLRKHRVRMAVATDHNPGTSPTLSLLLMLNMACTLFRLTPAEALVGATRNAAAALGWQNACGTLETGKAADFALWSITHPRDLCYYFGKNPCHSVVVGGDWHHFDGE